MQTLSKALARAFAAAALVAGLGVAGAASAAPAGPVAGLVDGGSLVEHVADGCGRGAFRGPSGLGRCRPIGFRRGFYAPPRFYGPRRYYAPRRFYGRPVYGPRRFYGPRY